MDKLKDINGVIHWVETEQGVENLKEFISGQIKYNGNTEHLIFCIVDGIVKGIKSNNTDMFYN